MNKALRLAIAITVSSFWLVSCSSAADLIIAHEKKSDYKIVIPLHSSPGELKAASELRSYIQQISGAELPVITDDNILEEKEIILGNNRHLELIKCRVNFDELGPDGFAIVTQGEYLVIAGGFEKGSLYGVYTLLEDHLGCRFYAPGAQLVPRLDSISLGKIKDRQVPVFDFRELHFPFALDSSYLVWHKLDRHDGGDWGMWVHTFQYLLPAERYFGEHPEYFSMINGTRVDDGQLCLSNPEVLEIVTENLKKKIEKRKEVTYWSVSQNDNYLACECEHCLALDEKYGGPAGTMIYFVNEVAKQFPDKTISTLAYQYTRSAPENIRPEKNVNIMLCTIECNRSRPIADDPSGKAFVKDLKDWSRLTSNILLWDYVVQFRNYISPFPNFHVLQPNLQLFEKYGCEMMFQQGSGQSWSDLSELKSYLIAKLLWDPGANADEIVNDFLYGYYGHAAPYIRQYFDMQHEELKRSGQDLWIYGYPYDGVTSFLSPILINEYEKVFDQAEEAVKDDPEFLRRVKKARLPLQFAVLDISLHDYNETLSYFDYRDGIPEIKPEMGERLDEFVEEALEAGIERIQEHGITPEEYRETVGRFILKTLEPNLARGKEVRVLTEYSTKYNPAGASALTDGLRGVLDYNFNWLGFQGEDMVAVIDLGKSTTVNRISADFMQFQNAWIFLPEEVLYYGSTDALNFYYLGGVDNTVPDDRPGIFTVPFAINLPGTSFRYLKVEARALKTCPEWHIGAGERSWIFVDEIVVQ